MKNLFRWIQTTWFSWYDPYHMDHMMIIYGAFHIVIPLYQIKWALCIRPYYFYWYKYATTCIDETFFVLELSESSAEFHNRRIRGGPILIWIDFEFHTVRYLWNFLPLAKISHHQINLFPTFLKEMSVNFTQQMICTMLYAAYSMVHII